MRENNWKINDEEEEVGFKGKSEIFSNESEWDKKNISIILKLQLETA